MGKINCEVFESCASRAVEPKSDAERMGIGDFIERHEPRTDRREGVERLTGHPLFARLAELPIARRDVVADHAAGDVLHRPVSVNVFAAATDRDHHFRLIIDFLTDGRQLDRIAVRDDARREFAEQDRLVGNGRVALDRVIAIVEAEADDLRRVGITGAKIASFSSIAIDPD